MILYMLRTCILLLLLTACNNNSGLAQIENIENYYAIDLEKKMILCHSKLMGILRTKGKKAKSITLQNDEYTFIDSPSNIDQTKSYKVLKGTDTLSLYFTSLPILKITSSQEIKDEPKNMALMSYADSTATHNASIGIELRGNSALKYPKKSYDLEIRVAENSEESKDLKFGNLRNDDDWILNSIYNEPLKLRSHFSTKLWLEITKTEGSAKKINDVMYTEVFLNNKYQGIYLLSEQVDRKQLKLKKIENGIAKGLLYKGNSSQNGTTFKSPTDFKNALPTWAGFEMKYPYLNYDSHWEGIHNLVSLVSETDEIFNSQIDQYLDVDNAMDYFLLVNLLRATDNLGKNYFIARKDEDTPFYFVPWDLDGVLGNVTDGIRIDKTEDILTNHLFDKLLKADPLDYRKKLKSRWLELRSSHYSNESLTAKLIESQTFLENFKIYERDAIAWPITTTTADDITYLNNWLEKRLVFLDSYFETM